MEKKDRSSNPNPEKKSNNSGDNSDRSTYARYIGMGVQMLIIILIFTWAGKKLDDRSGNEKPIYTAILALLGVFVGLYTALKDFIRPKDD
ncbi:AtpZ/AtpI family protein [Bacteroidota bacterium]